MMDHVVVNIHPFIMKQEVSAYRNGECIEHIECTMDEVADVCYGLCKKYDMHQVDYAGQKQFGLKLEEKFSYNYSDFLINFNYY